MLYEIVIILINEKHVRSISNLVVFPHLKVIRVRHMKRNIAELQEKLGQEIRDVGQ